MTSSPTPAVLPDARAREVLAECILAKPWGGGNGYDAEFWRTVRITGDEALFAMLQYAKEATPPASDAAVPARETDVTALVSNALGDHQLGNRPAIKKRLIADIRAALATSPKVASDTGAGLDRRKAVNTILARLLSDCAATASIDVQIAFGNSACTKIIAALATDATDGATGVGEGVGREELMEMLDLWHRHTAWPEASRSELQHAAEGIMRATTPGGDLLEQAARECQAVWRCAIGDFVGALDVLKNEWQGSRRKPERIAGEKLAGVLDLVWAARGPAPSSYSEAATAGQALIDRVDRALSARNQTDDGGEA